MKELIALVVFLVFSGGFIGLSVTKKIDKGLTSILLVFSIVSSLAIANYDVIKKLKWGGLELERFQDEVTTIKQDAINELEGEIKKQRNDLNNFSTQTKQDIDRVFQATTELSLLNAKMIYLQMQSKNQFGTEIDRKARAEITNSLNNVALIALPDIKKRSKWVNEVEGILSEQKMEK